MSDIAGEDTRKDTPLLKSKINLNLAPIDEEYDPAEPPRSSLRPAPTGVNEPATTEPAASVIQTAPAPPPAPAQAPAPGAVPPRPAKFQSNAPVGSPVRGYDRAQGSVTFTNRLSPGHRDLLGDLVNVEGTTIRAILERALDLYAATEHPELGR